MQSGLPQSAEFFSQGEKIKRMQNDQGNCGVARTALDFLSPIKSRPARK